MGIFDFFRSDSSREDEYQRSSNSSGEVMRGNTDRDPLAAQKPVHPSELTDQGYLDMYEGNMLARAMVDHISEDMVRAGWKFTSENDALTDTINDRFGELDIQDKMQSMIEDDMIYGDGFIGIGLSQRDLNIAEPVENPETIEAVEFLTSYDHEDISNMKTRGDLSQEGNLDLETQENYKEIVAYEIKGLARQVHKDRMLHLQMRPRKDDKKGMSFFLDKQLLLQVFDNALWSIGQALYQLAFKVVYTDLQGMDGEDVKDLRNRLETDLNVLTAFLLDKGDESTPKDELQFPSISQSISGLSDMIDFVEDCMSMGSKQPLSRLFGNQAGTVSGAEEDTRGYYDRIGGMQESGLKPLLRKVARYIMWADGTDPSSLEWDIEFNSLWEYDEQTEAEIGLTKSKKWLNYWKMGAVSGTEIAKKEGFEKVDKSLPDNFDLPEVSDANSN